MNRFRRLGFIDYNGRILVDKSLINVALQIEEIIAKEATKGALNSGSRKDSGC